MITKCILLSGCVVNGLVVMIYCVIIKKIP